MRRVVTNLVTNAANHAGSTVAVSVESGPAGHEVHVDDDGPGVPVGDRERIFERFIRLDEARSRDDGGTGLGLSIASELVVAHGGSVTVGDAPLGGARFTVSLPS
ncbi:MAG: ATP-binding protein [Actinomycetota bacterium]